MPQKIEIQEAKRRFGKIKKNYPEVSLDFNTYKSFGSKCKFIDLDYGEWWATPKNVVGLRCKHPHRAIAEQSQKRITPLAIVEERIQEKHGDIVTIVNKSSYDKMGSPILLKDKDFGEFWSTPARACNGHGHPWRGIIKCTTPRILSLGEIKRRLYNVHKNEIIIKDDTYISMYKKATFIHYLYGEWEATPSNVINRKSSHPNYSVEKSKKTFLQNYGVTNPNKNKDIFVKSAKSRWLTITVEHWKTKKEIVCMGSYEYAIVTVLNNNHIDYDWQIKFTLPDDGLVYLCDLLLKKDFKYIEIKGYFWSESSRYKWNLFNKIYPNSHLWGLKEVVEFSGKSEYGIKKQFREALIEKRLAANRCLG